MLFNPPLNASWIEPLPEGHQGTWRTLDAMRWLVRQDYQSDFTRHTVTTVTGQRPAEPPVSALFFWARDCIRFVDDPPDCERIASFEWTTQLGYGDCDDKCVWLATALLSIDVSARFVVQSYGEEWNHVYLEFFDWARFKWIALDPTADGHTGITGEVGWRQPLPSSGYEMRFSI